MATIDVVDPAGAKQGTAELDDKVFGIEPNTAVLHQVVTAQLAARRAGSQSTKTRAEVRGGGSKPWRQKGTGRARQGSIRSPQWRGGGVALGPKPRSFAQRTPKKMVSLALRSALSDRAADGKVVVVQEWGWETPSTKSARLALEALGIEGRALVVLARSDVTSARSFRNLPHVQIIEAGQLTAYEVLVADWIVFTEAALPGARSESAEPASVTSETPVAPRRAEPEAAVAAEPTDETQVGEAAPEEHSDAGQGDAAP